MAVNIDKGRALATLSLTPLIDVVFLLLVFFLVATRFEREDRELDVVLPSASEAQPLTEVPNKIWVNIDKDGKYFIEGKTVVLDEVARRLRLAATNNPGQTVIIRADRRVAFDYVAAAMNACNQARIFDYTVQTD